MGKGFRNQGSLARQYVMAPVFVAEGDVAGDVITHVTPVKDVRSGKLARNIREASPTHSELATVEEEDYVFIHKVKD